MAWITKLFLEQLREGKKCENELVKDRIKLTLNKKVNELTNEMGNQQPPPKVVMIDYGDGSETRRYSVSNDEFINSELA